ncbi:hypothetical protein DLJ49_14800 [Rhodovulum sp. 12E13]|uniref:hypothetical protein n=1 Tax=Rhodovulum sp. 12E13 TaxID=2203891 RepID=UPI000E155D9A|nr:hypothetical protein [Rhodovulum sp. 12E13]RDC71475.1 hypothetical protein DLJ49_14800 [Rhodovulum sp. 12E13]
MSYAPETSRPPLGVTELVGRVFRLFRERFQEIFLVSLLYSVVSLAVSLALIGPERTFGLTDQGTVPVGGEGGMGPGGMGPGAMGPGAMPMAQIGVGDLVDAVLQILLSALFVGAIALLVVDAARGRPAGAPEVLRRALGTALPVAAISIVIGVAVALGFVLLFVPGLWIFAVLSVAIPVAAVEGAGLGALGRSAALTKGYRWPIVGFGLVFAAIVLALTLVLGLFVLAPLGVMLTGGEPGLVGGLVLTLVTALVGAAYAGLGALPAPVLYLRLLELKEGGQGR